MFNSNFCKIGRISLALILFVGLNACDDHRLTPQNVPDTTFFALGSNNQLMRISAQKSSTPQLSVQITGLQADERILSIDFRPATGQLYGVGSSNRLYVINQATGAARAIGAGPFTPALMGNSVSIDFNPTVDRLRLVTAQGQNLRLNPETGAVVAVDMPLNGVSGAMIGGVAYTNNRAGVTSTVLLDIDPVTDKLYRQDPPNNGTLVEIGSLGLNVTAVGGFDIAPNGDAIVSVTFNGASELDQINVTTGRLQKIGDLPAGIIGIAIPTEPVAFAVDAANNLLIFNPMNPTVITKALTGLQMGETIVGIDVRPANGQLYAMGSSSRLYTINTANGAATAVGSGAFTPALTVSRYGFDFNPTVDRIRVVGIDGRNFRLHPDLGTVAATDANLNPGSPAVAAVAYTNNFAGATSTEMFDIETIEGTNSMLYLQSPPNAGTLVPVGSLGVQAEATNGFDVGGTTNIAYALLRVGGVVRIYTINLATGAATAGASLPNGIEVRGFAVGIGF